MLHTCSLNCVLHVVLDFLSEHLQQKAVCVYTFPLWTLGCFPLLWRSKLCPRGKHKWTVDILEISVQTEETKHLLFQVRWILRFHNSVFSLDSRCSQVYTSTDLTYDKFASIDSIFLFFVLLFLLYATFLPLGQSFNRKK